MEPKDNKKRTQGREGKGRHNGQRKGAGQRRNPPKGNRKNHNETSEMPRSLGETQEPHETKKVELWGHQKARTNKN